MKEVEDEEKHNKPKRIVLFGTRQRRADMHLRIIKEVCKGDASHNFGVNAATALADDGDWGTYVEEFTDTRFAKMLDSRLEKVVGPASGCALNFIQMLGGESIVAYAAGSTKERSGAQMLLSTLYA